MTSLISASALNTLSNNVPARTENTSSTNVHLHTSILSRILISWVDARRLQEQNAPETLTKDVRFGTLISQLLHEQQLTVDYTNNESISSSIRQSNVAQIVGILLENENTDLCPSTVIGDLAATSDNADGNGNATLEMVSSIILKMSMKPVLLGEDVSVSANRVCLSLMPSAIPKFQLGPLSLQDTFLDVRSALMSWVNQQFRSNIDYICVDLILDFGPSWRNGLAFILLVYCLNASYLSSDLQHWLHQQLQYGDGVRNDDNDNQASAMLSYVLDIGKQRMGILDYLTPQDMMEMVIMANEWCVMLYVFEFYMYGLRRKQKEQEATDTLVSDLQQALELVHSVSHSKNDKPLHPLDDIDAPTINEYSHNVSVALSLWNPYLSKIKNPCPQLVTSVSAMRQAYDFFTQGLTFTQISKEIRMDLDVVEDTLNDMETSLTIDSMRQLEYQVNKVKSLVIDMENQFGILVQQQRYGDHLQQLHRQVDRVCGWITQVQTWMVENDCIRARIQLWIDLIDERNAITDDLGCDPMTTMDLTTLDHFDADTLYYEHEQLKKDVDQLEAANSTKQLWEHVKQHTVTNDQQQQQHQQQQQFHSSPAGMLTLSISMITLNMLDRLWQLLMDRGLRIDQLKSRLKWEHLFEKAVEWIFLKDAEIDRFLRTQALWCGGDQDDDRYDNSSEKVTTSTILEEPALSLHYGQVLMEQKIDLLMQLEHDISTFDGDCIMGVWSAYQEMVDLFGGTPSFLKQRQLGFEAAFGDLTERCGLARQAVEQQLIMMDMARRFKDIKNDGEILRRKILVANDTMDGIFGSNTNGVGNGLSGTANDDGDGDSDSDSRTCGNDSADPDTNAFELCVENFKEAYTGFLVHVSSRVPYLKAPIMSTAMGALDSQSADATNDIIRNSLHAYGISLSLISDGLDQLLLVRQQIRSLQQRATLVCRQMERFTNWMDGRRRLLEKSDFDIYDFKDGGATTIIAEFVSRSILQNKNDLLVCLEKELGTITYRLQQMENDDMAKVFETVKILQSDMDGVDGVISNCQQKVVGALECLKGAQNNIKISIQARSSKLDALKRYLAWKSHWIRTHQWILSMARKLWDFCVKKAMYSPLAADNENKFSPAVQRDIEMALRSHQDRIADTGGNHMAALADLYTSMVDNFNNWEKLASLAANVGKSQVLGGNEIGVQLSTSSQVMHGYSTRQFTIAQNYRALLDLSQYAATLVTQRLAISNILIRLEDASRDGERLRVGMTKSTLQIMKTGHDQLQLLHQRQSPKEKVDLFRQAVTEIKKSTAALEYVEFIPNHKNGEHDSILSSSQTQQLQQDKDNAKALVISKMDELENLDGQLVDLLEKFDKAEKKRKLVDQYNTDVLALTRWIQEQTTVLENRQLNVAAETIDELLNGTSWNDLNKQHQQFVSMIVAFGTDRLKITHDKVVALVEDVATHSGGFLDVTVAVTQNLGSAINSFAALQQKVAGETDTIDTAGKRIEWAKVLQDAQVNLEQMQSRLAAWCKKMNEWINGDSFVCAINDWQEEAHEQMLVVLYVELEKLVASKDEFNKSTMVKVQLLYDTFVLCFPKLPRPTATPDHIADTMSSLHQSNARYQETLISKNKELDIIQGYVYWNTNFKTVRLASDDCLDKLNLFVSHTARWRPPATKKKLGNEDHLERRSEDDSSTIHQQCADLTQQLHDLEAQLDVLYEDASTNNASNIVIQRVLSQRDQLACFIRYVSQLVCIMDTVIKQNEMVQGLLLKMSQISDGLTLKLAERKSTRMVDCKDVNLMNTPRITDGDYYNKLIKQVDQLRSDISKMLYPVRPSMDYTNTSKSNDQSYWMALDYTDNNVVRNVLTGDLMELEHSMMELNRITQINNQPPQSLSDLPSSKQNTRLSNIYVAGKKTQGKEREVMTASRNATAEELTRSLSTSNYTMTSSPKFGNRQASNTRSYRSTTKITPGEVGKYWLGNSQPRLVYCRVLTSNVVMARVGGGWVELSQFLLDHGCSDGSAFLDQPTLSENISVGDQLANIDYETMKNSDSDSSLTLSRSSGKTSSSTRSLLSMAGYTDGYQYVRIDEWGNHLALDMVRFDDR